MSRPDKRLIFLAITIMVAAVIYSCTGVNNTDADFTETDVFLQAERLPTAPDSMVYELWVAKGVLSGNNVTAENVVSLGRFNYLSNDTIKTFLEADTLLPRADSNHFILNDNIEKFGSIIVSVERIDVMNNTPGPIMLVATITGIDDLVVRMNLPFDDDLHNATVRYNLEAVSDEDRNSGDGNGIWFTNYRLDTATFQDTTRFDFAWDSVEIVPEFRIDTTIDTTIDSSGPVWDTTINLNYLVIDSLDSVILPDSIIYYRTDTIPNPDVTVIETLVTELLNLDSILQPRLYDLESLVIDTFIITYKDSILLDLDSIVHVGISANDIVSVDTVYPFYKRFLDPDSTVIETGPIQTIILDVFNQDQFGLPVYANWGWKYEGWVVVENAVTDSHYLTVPPYIFNSAGNDWIPGHGGGLISTGTFDDIAKPDDGNPFTYTIYVGSIEVIDTNKITGVIDTIIDSVFKNPSYPGEDFLNSTELQNVYGPNVTPLSLVTSPGTALITLEPNNRLSTATNFPLILFRGVLPSGNPANGTFDMKNLSQSEPGGITVGLPEIVVTYIKK